jgi:murein L,D-transpeptidase YafK
MRKSLTTIGLAGLCVGMLAACSGPELPPAMKPLSKETMMLLGKKGMKQDAPIFVRVFKEESELEVWKLRDDGHFHHFKTYPICNWSGELGPKLAQGDKQAPEGFYTVHKSQLNPNSQFHLAFNLGFPNSYDKAHGRTGSALMVHGKCRSAGCYAMTDALIEEIYALARDQFTEGQDAFRVHAFPFRMTAENMARHRTSKWYPFWLTLKEGYDYFETTRQLPPIAVCERRYHVNVRPISTVSTKIDPQGRCPAFERPEIVAYKPSPSAARTAAAPVIVPGPKMRAIAAADAAEPSRSAQSAAPLLSTNGLLRGLGFASGQ